MITIRLNTKDLELVEELAEIRNNKPVHTSRKWMKNVSNLDTHRFGIKCELAFALATDMTIDTHFYPSGDTTDFHIEGKTIEVKGRNSERYQKPDLLVETHSAESDLYVLAQSTLTTPGVMIVGWCSKQTLIKKQRDFGYGLRYYCPRSSLSNIHKLVNRIQDITTIHHQMAWDYELAYPEGHHSPEMW